MTPLRDIYQPIIYEIKTLKNRLVYDNKIESTTLLERGIDEDYVKIILENESLMKKKHRLEKELNYNTKEQEELLIGMGDLMKEINELTEVKNKLIKENKSLKIIMLLLYIFIIGCCLLFICFKIIKK